MDFPSFLTIGVIMLVGFLFVCSVTQLRRSVTFVEFLFSLNLVKLNTLTSAGLKSSRSRWNSFCFSHLDCRACRRLEFVLILMLMCLVSMLL